MINLLSLGVLLMKLLGTAAILLLERSRSSSLGKFCWKMRGNLVRLLPARLRLVRLERRSVMERL